MSRYRVAGPHRVLDTDPGEVVEQEIPELQAAQLVAGGSLEVVEDDQSPESSDMVSEGSPVPAADLPQEGD